MKSTDEIKARAVALRDERLMDDVTEKEFLRTSAVANEDYGLYVREYIWALLMAYSTNLLRDTR